MSVEDASVEPDAGPVVEELESCLDGRSSPGEPSVDCGGPCVARCADHAFCNVDDDCISDVCHGSTCFPHFGPARAVAVGAEHACAITHDDRVACWGDNGSSSLGYTPPSGTQAPRLLEGLDLRVVAIAANANTNCAVTDDGAAYCWGGGYLGSEDFDSEMPAPVRVELEDVVTAVDVGNDGRCALTANGDVYCWGDNDHGQLGDGTEEYRSTPVAMTVVDAAFDAIAAGFSTSCGLTRGGEVWCWGFNNDDSIGGVEVQSFQVPGLPSDVVSVISRWGRFCAITQANGVWCWTDEVVSPERVVELGDRPRDVSIGLGFACGIDEEGDVLCWGVNYDGALGQPLELSESATPIVVEGIDDAAISIDSGGYRTCAVLAGGGISCWGGSYLGHGFQGGSAEPVRALGFP